MYGPFHENNLYSLDKTIASMPKRVEDIIKLKGPRTTYYNFKMKLM